MSEYKEISRTSREIEPIKLNSDGCNLNLVSVLVRFQLMSYFCYAFLSHPMIDSYLAPPRIHNNLKSSVQLRCMKTGIYLMYSSTLILFFFISLSHLLTHTHTTTSVKSTRIQVLYLTRM